MLSEIRSPLNFALASGSFFALRIGYVQQYFHLNVLLQTVGYFFMKSILLLPSAKRAREGVLHLHFFPCFIG